VVNLSARTAAGASIAVRHRDCRNLTSGRNALSAAQGLFAGQDVEVEDNQGPADNDDAVGW
jgi:hypothetical protein